MITCWNCRFPSQ